MNTQIPLKIGFNRACSFDNYCTGENAAVVQRLRAAALAQDKGAEASLWFLAGATATGKSHLAQAFCAEAEGDGRRSLFFSMGELHAHLQEGGEFDANWFEGFTQYELIAIDDFDCLERAPEGSREALEEALFVLVNRILLEGNTTLLLTSSRPVAALRIDLPDLRSRLGLFISLSLQENTDEVLLQIMASKASERGLTLTDEVAQFLLRRLPRDTQSIVDVMQRLDEFSMTTVRPLTVPMVKDALAL